MVKYELGCLKILEAFGGVVNTNAIMSHFDKQFNEKISAQDKLYTEYGQLRWHMNIYHALLSLKASGLAINSNRGWWQLTELGKEWMNAHGNQDWETCCHNLGKNDWHNLSKNEQTDVGTIYSGPSDQNGIKETEPSFSILDEYKLGTLAKNIVLRVQDIVKRKTPHCSDDELCGLIEFCYRLELYPEGAYLFGFIDAAKIEPALYDRFKLIASVCRLRSFQ